MTSETPDAIIKWATCCLQWESEKARGNPTPDQSSKELQTTDGCKAILLATDVKVLQSTAVQEACGFMPAFRQCIIDKPEVCSKLIQFIIFMGSSKNFDLNSCKFRQLVVKIDP